MDTVFRDVTGEVTGLSGFQVKSVNAKGKFSANEINVTVTKDGYQRGNFV